MDSQARVDVRHGGVIGHVDVESAIQRVVAQIARFNADPPALPESAGDGLLTRLPESESELKTEPSESSDPYEGAFPKPAPSTRISTTRVGLQQKAGWLTRRACCVSLAGVRYMEVRCFEGRLTLAGQVSRAVH